MPVESGNPWCGEVWKPSCGPGKLNQTKETIRVSFLLGPWTEGVFGLPATCGESPLVLWLLASMHSPKYRERDWRPRQDSLPLVQGKAPGWFHVDKSGISRWTIHF